MIRVFIAGAVLFSVMGLVGTMDYNDEIAQHEVCLRNVADGIWPKQVCE